MLQKTANLPVIKAEFLKRFGDNLKRIRSEKGISQQELVQRLGTSQSYLAKIELGQVNPSISKAASIANALGVPVSLLFEFGVSTN